ncbi:response regulator transcription factor [candidate division TA06 bacterium]|nr:response regulator transcription factor [candidate division TA06 bacterium]
MKYNTDYLRYWVLSQINNEKALSKTKSPFISITFKRGPTVQYSKDKQMKVLATFADEGFCEITPPGSVALLRGGFPKKNNTKNYWIKVDISSITKEIKKIKKKYRNIDKKLNVIIEKSKAKAHVYSDEIYPIVINEKFEIFYRNKIVKLKKRHGKLLIIFMEHPGKYYSKQALIEIMWAGRKKPGDMETIPKYISDIRNCFKKKVKYNILPHNNLGYKIDLTKC